MIDKSSAAWYHQHQSRHRTIKVRVSVPTDIIVHVENAVLHNNDSNAAMTSKPLTDKSNAVLPPTNAMTNASSSRQAQIPPVSKAGALSSDYATFTITIFANDFSISSNCISENSRAQATKPSSDAAAATNSTTNTPTTAPAAAANLSQQPTNHIPPLQAHVNQARMQSNKEMAHWPWGMVQLQQYDPSIYIGNSSNNIGCITFGAVAMHVMQQQQAWMTSCHYHQHHLFSMQGTTIAAWIATEGQNTRGLTPCYYCLHERSQHPKQVGLF